MAKTVTDSYMELIQRFRLRQIRSEKEHRQATRVIHALLDKPGLDAGEKEYLDALSDLVWLYEEEHHPIEDLDPPEMLASMIEHKGVSQRTVAAETGIPVSTISELISRKRGFTLSHVQRFSSYFGFGMDVFLYQELEDSRKVMAKVRAGKEKLIPLADVAARLELKVPKAKAKRRNHGNRGDVDRT